MQLVTKFGIVAACTLACLIAFDIAGVLLCLLLEIFTSSRSQSAALFFVVWLVIGIFCGMLCYSISGSVVTGESKGDAWMKRPDAPATGRLIVAGMTIVLATVGLLCYRFLWRNAMAPSAYVPDSPPHTIVFLATTCAACIFAHKTASPAIPAAKVPPADQHSAGRPRAHR